MLTLELPWILALLPLPLLVYFLAPAASNTDSAIYVPFFARLPSDQDTQSLRPRGNFLNWCVLFVMWLCLLLACARPVWIGEPVSLPSSGRDLLLAVDISGSMETEDMKWSGRQINRLTTVKAVVGEFVERRQSDRLGLILFGTQAYLQAPLTFDRITVKQLLQEAQVGFAGEKTAIGDAIGMAVKRLRHRPENSRILILLTDGANTAGEIAPLKAAELAAKAGIKIYTVGIGAEQMMKPGLFGARRVNPSRDLDENTLTEIANSTGGRYFRARSPQELQLIYLELDQLEPIAQEAEVFRPTRALFYWPLAITMLLALLLIARPLLTQPFSTRQESI